jgi:hypothetical protein
MVRRAVVATSPVARPEFAGFAELVQAAGVVVAAAVPSPATSK